LDTISEITHTHNSLDICEGEKDLDDLMNISDRHSEYLNSVKYNVPIGDKILDNLKITTEGKDHQEALEEVYKKVNPDLIKYTDIEKNKNKAEPFFSLNSLKMNFLKEYESYASVRKK